MGVGSLFIFLLVPVMQEELLHGTSGNNIKKEMQAGLFGGVRGASGMAEYTTPVESRTVWFDEHFGC